MLKISEPEKPNKAASKLEFSLFENGFRPFFLFGTIYGIIILPIFLFNYLGVWTGNLIPEDIIHWHKHEMLFGFTAAIIIGFLLTAISNWTGRMPINGKKLATLFLVWLVGRIAILLPQEIDINFGMLLECSFLILSGYMIIRELLESGNHNNYIFIGLLLLLNIANILTYTEFSATGFEIGLSTITLIISVLGGRVIPFFTEKRLSLTIKRIPALERLVLYSTAMALLLKCSIDSGIITGVFFAICTIAHSIRFFLWKPIFSHGVPILWILHYGYFALIIHFILEALCNFDFGISQTISTHALTSGAISSLILGMIVRVSLGHTGRNIEAGNAMWQAFIAIICASIIRVLGMMIVDDTPNEILAIAGGLWIFAYALFVIKFTKILLFR
jgi:uncharacterized protein involved in response to NO